MKSFLFAALFGAVTAAASAQTKWDLPTGYSVGSFQTENVQRFFVNGFGAGTTVGVDVKFEAGDRQDGRPAEQLVIIPSIVVPFLNQPH